MSLGVTLFLRHSKGVSLTPEGEVLYSYVKRGYEAFSFGEEMMKKMRKLEFGEIRIGASDMTLQYYLLPFLEQFHKDYPRIKVTVTNGPTPETLNYLSEGRIDFCVVSEPIQMDSNYSVIRVKEIQDVFIVGELYQSLSEKTISFAELEGKPIICLERNTSSRQYIDHYLKENDVTLMPEFELATSNMIVQFALRNLGIGLVVYDFARDYIESGKLHLLKFSQQVPKRHFCIVREKQQSISGAALQLIKMMEQEVL